MIPANRITIPANQAWLTFDINGEPVRAQLWSRAPGTSKWWAIGKTTTGHELFGALLVHETPSGWIPQLRPDMWDLGSGAVAPEHVIAEKWPVIAQPEPEPACPFGTADLLELMPA